MKRGKINLVLGLQAGSESKGKISSYLVDKYKPDLIVGSFSPNAGHTLIKDGSKIVTHNIPVCSYMSNSPIVLCAGSAIDLDILKMDLITCKVPKNRLFIDKRAVIIQKRHKNIESKELLYIASTTSGVGAAFSDRLKRVNKPILARDFSSKINKIGTLINASDIINDCLHDKKLIIGEMTQGFDLDLLHGIEYPYTTSRAINPSQFLSDCGVSPSKIGTIYGVFRPYPIRVGNYKGFSGPYDSSPEISWNDIKQRCSADRDITEYTTKTKRIRRVFEFSWSRFKKAINIVNPNLLVLNFANYIDWNIYKCSDKSNICRKVKDFITFIEDVYKIPIGLIGTGPDHKSIIDLLYKYEEPSSRGMLYIMALNKIREENNELL